MSRVRAAVLLAVTVCALTVCAVTPAPLAAAASGGHRTAPLAAPGRATPGRAAPGRAATRALADLTGVSCTSASACTAVGSTDVGMLAERWNGRRWAIQPTPSPGSGTALSGVSCAGPAMCMAVGSTGNPNPNPQAPLAELWNGHTWGVLPPVTPPHRHAGLLGVSCPDPAMCMAVGEVNNGPALAELWDGKSWAIKRLPRVAGAQLTLLTAVSCTSPAACTAVGSYAGLNALGVVLERWNGTAWAVQDTRPGAGLPGVSCAAATACTAVGSAQPPNGYPVTSAFGWNGTRWAAQHPPNPAHNAGAELSSVSCPSPAACLAVGDYFQVASSGSGYVALAERWNGDTWALMPTPSTRRTTFLTGVSCSSAAACMAVGTSFGEPLAERWDGARWVTVPIPSPRPVPIPGSGSLTGVSCTAAANCTAAGSELTTASTSQQPLAEHWNGSRWSAQPVRNPVFAGDGSEFSAVSCTSGSACTAVGQRGSGLSVPLAERWDGSQWAVQSTPSTPGNDTSLNGVACTSAASCTAVGLFITPRGLLLTFGEHWDGTRWVRQHTPSPPAAPGVGGGQLSAIGCSSAHACTAVGQGELVPPVIERWNGATWVMQHSPRVQHPGPGELTSVSCPAAAACLAAGDTGGSETNFHASALAERWDGTTWVIQRVPQPTGTTDSYLNGISCSSPVACTAAGDWYNRTGRSFLLAERWNGKAWAIQHTPTPPGGGGVFNAVSCPSATDCVAVGQDSAGPLAARWDGTTWTLIRVPGR